MIQCAVRSTRTSCCLIALLCGPSAVESCTPSLTTKLTVFICGCWNIVGGQVRKIILFIREIKWQKKDLPIRSAIALFQFFN